MPEAAFRFLRPKARRLDREHLWRIDLDARRCVIGFEIVSIGTLSASLVHPREVLKGAILANAAGSMIAHNHPSGDETPSAEDRDVTQRVRRAGELMGIPLIDHLVIGGERFYSFRESGLL
jgi:DNA repair protein RadC